MLWLELVHVPRVLFRVVLVRWFTWVSGGLPTEWTETWGSEEGSEPGNQRRGEGGPVVRLCLAHVNGTVWS